MAEDRLIAGIRCHEVMADLSEYVDGQLTDDRVEQIQLHLKDCDWCERFGGRFSQVITTLRHELGSAEPVPDEVRQRLRDRLKKEIEQG